MNPTQILSRVVALGGLLSPGLPLVSFGLPSDCFLHASIDVTSPPDWFPGSTQNWTSLILPALPPSFSGFQFYCQSVTMTSSGFGPSTRFSNGVKCTVGTL